MRPPAPPSSLAPGSRRRSTRSCWRCSPPTRASARRTPRLVTARRSRPGRAARRARGRGRPHGRARAPGRRALAGVDRRGAHDRAGRRAGDRQDDAARRAGGRGRPPRRRRAVGPRRPRGSRLRRLALGAAGAAGPVAGTRRSRGCSAAAGAPGGEQDRLRLFDAVADLLARAAADQPLLVILDDLHWADASSLRLLAHVVDAEPGARLLVACSSRQSRSTCAQIEGDRAETLELPGSRPTRCARCCRPSCRRRRSRPSTRRTAGNPFYVVELGRLLAGAGEDRAHALPRGSARSCARAWSVSAPDPARCSRSAPSPAGSRSPTSCAPPACRAPRWRRRSTAASRPGWSPRPPTHPGISSSRTRSCATPSATHCPVRAAPRCTRRSPTRCACAATPAPTSPRPDRPPRARRRPHRRRSAAGLGGGAGGGARGGGGARPRRGGAPLRRRAGGARARRRGARRGAPRDAARARRRDVRGRRHRGGPPPLLAGRGRGAAATATRRRWPRRARLLAGPSVRRGRHRGMTLLTEARERLPPTGRCAPR